MKALEERFWAKVDRTGGPEACWLWSGKVNNGYGEFCTGGAKWERAHRVAYELVVGPIPAGLCVCHRCDVKLCCRPSHLWLGTRADNNADRDLKGRTGNGERNRHAVLESDQIMEIRSKFSKGFTWRQLAKEYGISWQQVKKICNGKRWSHLPLIPRP